MIIQDAPLRLSFIYFGNLLRMKKIILTSFLLVILSSLSAQKIPFQGKLTQNDEPFTGSADFTFSIAGGWTEAHPAVGVLDGFYSVILGSVTPLPDTLFDTSDEVELIINVDGTDLSPVTLYAPYGAKVGRFVILDSQDTTTTALRVINQSTGTTFGEGSRTGAYIEARGEGLNTGLFTYAENGRSINNQTELTDPSVYVTGQISSLYGNTDVGGRAMQGQFTATGPGHGIGLSGYAGGGGKNWGVWGRANALSDSMQVGGYLEAFGPGTGEQYGVWGQASGNASSRNVGVYGTAFGSANENWAGWFDGDVRVTGNGEFNFVRVQPPDLAGSEMSAQAFLHRGDDQEINGWMGFNWLDGGSQANNRGALILFGDTLTRDVLGGVDIRRVSLTVADDGFGKDVGNLQLMAPVPGDNLLAELGIVSDSSVYKGKLTLKGSDGSFFEITSDGIGGGPSVSQAKYLLTDSVSSWMTFDAGFGLTGQLNFTGPNASPGGSSIGTKGWEAINPRNGYVHVKDSTGGQAVRIEALTDSTTTYGFVELNSLTGNRTELTTGELSFQSSGISRTSLFNNGNLFLYDTLGNTGLRATTTPGGRGNIFTYNDNHANVSWFGGIGNDGFVQLVSYDAADSASGAVLLGSFVDGVLPEVYLEGSAQQNFGLARLRVTQLGGSTEETARLEINRSNGGGQAAMTIVQDSSGADPTGSTGELLLFGDTSPNVQLGGKQWENHDLGYLNLFGSIPDGGGWNLTSVFMETQSDGAGRESGRLGLNTNLLADTSSVETVILSANLFGNGGGGLELIDPTGVPRITLDGEFGTATFDGDVTINGQLNVAGGIPLNQDSIATQRLQLLDTAGLNRGGLFVEDGSAELVLRGANDSLSVTMGSSGANGPYLGSFNLYDSIGENKVIINARNTGGFLQLAQKDLGGNFQSALQASATNSNSSLTMFGQNETQDNVEVMIRNYVTANQIDLGPVMSGNYRRSGTDWLDNQGRLLAAIGNSRDETGADITGTSGYLSLWGTNSFNAQLTGKRRENNNYPILQLFGSTPDTTGFFLPNVELEVNTDGSTKDWSELRLLTSDTATRTSAQTVRLTGDFNALGTGGLLLGNIAGAARTSIGVNDIGGNNYGEIILSNDTSATQSVLLDGFNGNIEITGTFIQASDRRLKTDIKTQMNSLDKIKTLRGVEFAWINQNKPKGNIGFIAQEVEEVYPEIVHTREDGYKAVDYASLVSALVEAIKELDQKVSALEAENNELKASLASSQSDDIAALKKEIDAIKKIIGTSVQGAGK